MSRCARCQANRLAPRRFHHKFPRLMKKEAKARLKEIKRLLLAI
jgi:hypothetical protein